MSSRALVLTVITVAAALTGTSLGLRPAPSGGASPDRSHHVVEIRQLRFPPANLFVAPADDRRVARNVFQSLKPGGVAVIDMMGKENLARIFKPREWVENDGEIWLYERKLSRAWSWLENRWIVFKNGERKEFTLSHRLYSASELMRLLQECGFTSTEAYGDLDGSPYDQEASRLVVVARKE